MTKSSRPINSVMSQAYYYQKLQRSARIYGVVEHREANESSTDRAMTEPIPPGETIAEEMEARHWSREFLAMSLYIKDQKTVDGLLDGTTPIGVDMACRLAWAFRGPAPEFWLRLEDAYRKALADDQWPNDAAHAGSLDDW